jgi:hypothetical protein
MRRCGVAWSLAAAMALSACDRAPAPAPVATAIATTTLPRPGEGATAAAPQPSLAPSAEPEPRPAGAATGAVDRPGAKHEPPAAQSSPAPAKVAPLASASAPASAPPAPLASVAPSAAPEVTSPQVGAATFSVWMSGAGRYKAGQPGVAQVVLVARGGFHCNPQYPYRLKLGAAPPGVSYPEPVVRKESMSVAPERSVMTVPFVPSAPGDARIGGTFSFSVCSDATCQIESREVALTVHVD